MWYCGSGYRSRDCRESAKRVIPRLSKIRRTRSGTFFPGGPGDTRTLAKSPKTIESKRGEKSNGKVLSAIADKGPETRLREINGIYDEIFVTESYDASALTYFEK